ncbi:MAG: hypothetical protein WDN26_03510 [Chitinophagaceae bacterium]
MKYIFVLIFVIINSMCSGQVKIINQSLTDTSVNIFYTGVDNRIMLKAKNPNEYSVAIVGAGGMLSKISATEYLVRISKIDSCKLIIKKNNKEVLVKNYTIGILPDRVATISGLRDTSIKLSRLLLNPLITVTLPRCYFRHGMHIMGFQATIIQGYDSIATYSNFNELFPAEMVKDIKQLTSGDKIYFDSIRAVSPDGRFQKLSPFWIKIE